MKQRPRGKAPSGWSAEDLGPAEDGAETVPGPPPGGVWLIDDLVEPDSSAAAAASLRRLENDRTDLWRHEPAAPPELDLNLLKPLDERLESRPTPSRPARRKNAPVVGGPMQESAPGFAGAPFGSQSQSQSQPQPQPQSQRPVEPEAGPSLWHSSASLPRDAPKPPPLPPKSAITSPDFGPTAFPFRSVEPPAPSTAPSTPSSTPSVGRRRAKPATEDVPPSAAPASALGADGSDDVPSEPESDVYDLVAEAFGRSAPKPTRRAKLEPEPVAAEVEVAAEVVAEVAPLPEPATVKPKVAAPVTVAVPATVKPEAGLWRADSSSTGSASSLAFIPPVTPVAKPTNGAASARRTYARLPDPEVAPAPKPSPAPAPVLPSAPVSSPASALAPSSALAPAPAPAPSSAPAPAPIEPLPIDPRSAFEPRVIEPPVPEWPGFGSAPIDRALLDPTLFEPAPPIPDLPPVVQRPVASRPAVERPDLAWPEFSWPEADSRGPFEPKLSRSKAPKPTFDAEQFGEPGHEEFPEPQQVPLPDAAPDGGWLDTVHWHDASESESDADQAAGPHGRRPSPFRRRKGDTA